MTEDDFRPYTFLKTCSTSRGYFKDKVHSRNMYTKIKTKIKHNRKTKEGT